MSHAAANVATVFLLPGWQNSGAGHWQTHWERRRGYRRVEQSDWLWPRRGDWMARLDEAVLAESDDVWLVAHSLGCHLVAAWAAHSRHVGRVRGALLVAPPDTEREDLPPQLHGWRVGPGVRLPFASTLVYSSDDPYATPERSASLAQDWGASLCSLGAYGHINGDSGLGDWDEGHRLFEALMATETHRTSTAATQGSAARMN